MNVNDLRLAIIEVTAQAFLIWNINPYQSIFVNLMSAIADGVDFFLNILSYDGASKPKTSQSQLPFEPESLAWLVC